MFSYARNSCHRNHMRFTLCGHHFIEEHDGRWQDCPECRNAFETEMFVWYGTNEYNFEALADPPAYEPTRCYKCGQVIKLGEDGYSISSKGYSCERCMMGKFGDMPAFPDAPDVLDIPEGDEDSHKMASPFLRLIPNPSSEIEHDETLLDVPDDYTERFAEIMELTAAFCDTHLNEEYKELCCHMSVAVCQHGSPVLKGKAESWAAGIVYALGRVNFLSDPSQEPHLDTPQIAKGFGVSVSNMLAKAKVIREGLDLMPFDPAWTLKSMMDENPLIWLMEVNGFLIDVRDAPRDIQAEIYEQGLIPYIPADQTE